MRSTWREAFGRGVKLPAFAVSPYWIAEVEKQLLQFFLTSFGLIMNQAERPPRCFTHPSLRKNVCSFFFHSSNIVAGREFGGLTNDKQRSLVSICASD